MRSTAPLSRLLFLLIPVLVFLADSWCGAARTMVDGVAATVNGEVVTMSEVAKIVDTQEMIMKRIYPPGSPILKQKVAEVEKQALQDLIDRVLVLQEFKKMGGTIRPQIIDDAVRRIIRERFDDDRDKFLSELRKFGMGLPEFKELEEKKLIVQIMRTRESRKAGISTPNELDEFYKKNKKALYREKDYVKLRMITFGKVGPDGTEQKPLAEDVRRKLVEEGADFATMAKSYSQDSRAEDGGDWDWIEGETLRKDLSEIAFGLKENQVSQIIEDDRSLRIMMVEAKRYGATKPFKEVKEDVERRVLLEKRKEAVGRWMGRLRKKSNIRMFK